MLFKFTLHDGISTVVYKNIIRGFPDLTRGLDFGETFEHHTSKYIRIGNAGVPLSKSCILKIMK